MVEFSYTKIRNSNRSKENSVISHHFISFSHFVNLTNLHVPHCTHPVDPHGRSALKQMRPVISSVAILICV